MVELVAYLTVGVGAGFAAGLLGIGGGLIIVPALAALFAAQSAEFAMHLAIGTSLASIVLTGLSSTYAHHRHGAVQWPVVAWLAPGLLVGSYLGALLADHLNGAVLSKLFGIFCCFSAFQLWRDRTALSTAARPIRWLLSAVGTLIGAISALVGIGGGSLTVPFLVWRGTPAAQAVACAAAGGVPIALAGSAGFVLTGLSRELPSQTLGYVYLPAFLGIALSSVLVAPLGARFAQRLPAQTLRKIFAIFLLLLGAGMLLR